MVPAKALPKSPNLANSSSSSSRDSPKSDPPVLGVAVVSSLLLDADEDEPFVLLMVVVEAAAPAGGTNHFLYNGARDADDDDEAYVFVMAVTIFCCSRCRPSCFCAYFKLEDDHRRLLWLAGKTTRPNSGVPKIRSDVDVVL